MMSSLALLLILWSPPASPSTCPGESVPCPGGDGGCLPLTSLCDGRIACLDNSDEDPTFCASHSCPQGSSKCYGSSGQCLDDNIFCWKASWRPHRQQPSGLGCRDGTTNLASTCKEMTGLNCSSSPIHWQCGLSELHDPARTLEEDCLDRNYVCDGVPDCQTEEDESKSLCSTWECGPGMTSCPSSPSSLCIRDQQICNGVPNCPQGEDEREMSTSDGTIVRCGMAGTSCRIYSRNFPGANYSDSGVFCALPLDDNSGSGALKAIPGGIHREHRKRSKAPKCLPQKAWCNGRCDCPVCEDETSGCEDWQCGEGRFKCQVSRICISARKICDGVFDCGPGDRSDEHSCPCSADESDTPLALPWWIRRAGSKCLLETDTCSRALDTRIHSVRKLVEVFLPSSCEIRKNCTFSSIFSEHRSRGRPYFTVTYLPLAHKGFVHQFDNREPDPQSIGKCVGRPGWDIEERILQSAVGDDVCNLLYSPARLNYLNEWEKLKIRKDDIRSYIKNTLNKFLGQNEVYGFFENITEETPLVYQINLGDFYPVVSYSKDQNMTGPTLEDKNLPMNAVVFSLPIACSSASKDTHDLLLLAKLASSKLLRMREGGPWQTLRPEDCLHLEDLLCHTGGFSHTYSQEDGSLLFLVLHNDVGNTGTLDKKLRFFVANQREDLRRTKHKMRALNSTREITVVFQPTNGHSWEEVINKDLMQFLYLRNDISGEGYIQFHLTNIVRKEKYYFQKEGNMSLNTILSDYNISDYDDASLFEICQNGILYKLLRGGGCNSTSLKSVEDIIKTINSRWIPESTCINIELNQNQFVLLPSISDDFFTPPATLYDKVSKMLSMINVTESKLPHFNVYQIGEENRLQLLKNEKKTFIAIPEHSHNNKRFKAAYNEFVTSGNLFEDEVFQEKMTTYPSFYLSTALSATINHEEDCLSELSGGQLTFYQEDQWNYLGPAENIWSSACAGDLSMDVVSDIMAATDHGVLFLNKLWICTAYNYLVYSDNAECSFLSTTCWVLEILFLTILLLLILVPVFGNTVTIAVIVIKEKKKTIYQYLQVSLCVADLLLALCGPLMTFIISILIINGQVTMADFMEPDLFSKFQHPREAAKIGFSNFLRTNKPWLVAGGIGVSLSTTVSMVNIAAMACIRWAITSGKMETIRFLSSHSMLLVPAPWAIGAVATVLFLWDFESSTLQLQAFFDPLSKITILLPSTAASVSFHIQVFITSVFLLLAVIFTILAWLNIRRFRMELQSKNMIKQEEQMEKRLVEESRWLLQSCCILGGFSTSLLPVFIFYVLSTATSWTMPPVLDLFAWWLFLSGASFNFIIYNFINPGFRNKFLSLIGCVIQVRQRKKSYGESSTKITFFSRSSKSKENPVADKKNSAVWKDNALVPLKEEANMVLTVLS